MRAGHKTPWPGREGHSEDGRPQIYRGSESGTWWVDDSGTNPLAWTDNEDDWEQQGFATWPEALAHALACVAKAARRESIW